MHADTEGFSPDEATTATHTAFPDLQSSVQPAVVRTTSTELPDAPLSCEGIRREQGAPPVESPSLPVAPQAAPTPSASVPTEIPLLTVETGPAGSVEWRSAAEESELTQPAEAVPDNTVVLEPGRGPLIPSPRTRDLPTSFQTVEAPLQQALGLPESPFAQVPEATSAPASAPPAAADGEAFADSGAAVSEPQESTPRCPPRTADAGMPGLLPASRADVAALTLEAAIQGLPETLDSPPLAGPVKDFGSSNLSLPSVPDLPKPHTVAKFQRANSGGVKFEGAPASGKPAAKVESMRAQTSEPMPPMQPANLAGLLPIVEFKYVGQKSRQLGGQPLPGEEERWASNVEDEMPYTAVDDGDEERGKPFVLLSPISPERQAMPEQQVRQQQPAQQPLPQQPEQLTDVPEQLPQCGLEGTGRAGLPVRSALRKANGGTTDGDDRAARKRSVSIGSTDVLEVPSVSEVIVRESKNGFRWHAQQEQVEERIFIRVARRSGTFAPLVTKNATGLTVAWGAEDSLTLSQFSNLITQAVEQLAAQQRIQWEGPAEGQCPGPLVVGDEWRPVYSPRQPGRGLFQHEHPVRNSIAARRAASSDGRCFTERKFLMQEGSFSILALTVQGEELDAYADTVFNPRDGCRVVCHAEVRKYEAPTPCVACCSLQ